MLHRPLRVIHAWNLPITVDAGRFPMSAREPGVGDGERIFKLRAENSDLEVEGVLAEEYLSPALTRGASGAELLVVGSHGRNAMDRYLVGSVSREVLSRPPCPVAVLRPRRSA